MSLVMRAYLAARGELGVKEIPGSKDNPRIIEYQKATDLNPEILSDSEVPWCSCFCNWALQKVGGKGTRSAWAKSFLGWGKKSVGNLGDICVLSRGKDKGHVGFLVEKGYLYVKLIGGNQSNQVSIQKYPRWRVLGYRTSLDVA